MKALIYFPVLGFRPQGSGFRVQGSSFRILHERLSQAVGGLCLHLVLRTGSHELPRRRMSQLCAGGVL